MGRCRAINAHTAPAAAPRPAPKRAARMLLNPQAEPCRGTASRPPPCKPGPNPAHVLPSSACHAGAAHPVRGPHPPTARTRFTHSTHTSASARVRQPTRRTLATAPVWCAVAPAATRKGGGCGSNAAAGGGRKGRAAAAARGAGGASDPPAAHEPRQEEAQRLPKGGPRLAAAAGAPAPAPAPRAWLGCHAMLRRVLFPAAVVPGGTPSAAGLIG